MSNITALDKTLIAYFLEENFHDFCEHLEANGAIGDDGDAESFGERLLGVLYKESNE